MKKCCLITMSKAHSKAAHIKQAKLFSSEPWI